MSQEIVIFDVEEVKITPTEPVRGVDPMRGPVKSRAREVVERVVDVGVLGENLSAFIANIRDMLAQLPEKAGDFEVEKVEVQASISGKGKVGFIGTGAEAQAGASLKLVLARRPAATASAKVSDGG